MQRLGMLLLCGLLLLGCQETHNDDQETEEPFTLVLDIESDTAGQDDGLEEALAVDHADLMAMLAALECPDHSFPVVGVKPEHAVVEWACILAWIPAPEVDGFEIQQP